MIPYKLPSSPFSIPPNSAHPLISNLASFAALCSPPPPTTTRRCCRPARCRRAVSSFDPNAESIRGGRFGFRSESSVGEEGVDCGQDRRGKWWSDSPSEDDYIDEEFDPSDDEFDGSERLWDKIWIFKVFKAYGYLLPAIIASMLLASGPKAFLMALAVPLGHSAISIAMEKLQGDKRHRRKPFSSSRSEFGKQGKDEWSDFRKSDVYESWVEADVGLDDKRVSESEPPNFGGWDELDGRRVDARWQPNGSNGSTKSGHAMSSKFSKKSYGDTPLLLRLLVAMFPFLGSWFRIF
ncbi:hypothetical protein HPP92_025507 [Vanilla planifolia]|uniref:Uncharacterized protein n=1 Tax=Vanilla planifolia TaxID=51239 RepID=A0A835PMW5_VANPL|nr:hypothetical protein HPP92_025507 [Vanilla planifolia]